MQRVNFNGFWKCNLPVDYPNTNVLLEKTKKTLITGQKEKNKFHISQLKHMLLVLKSSVSMKWFF